MCCLFGILDYGHSLTRKQRTKLTHALAAAAELRGTDASGIAYCSNGRMQVYKKPVPGRYLRARVPEDAHVILGHARMTTQGTAKRNFNNHPFLATAGTQEFALAHNGVLYNDTELQKREKLPATRVETDSYVAVQLLEKKGQLSFESLRYMAELLKGTFTLTVLDRRNNLYFVKGDNPLTIYHYSDLGLYLYASTEAVLDIALEGNSYLPKNADLVRINTGEILMIDAVGQQSRSEFDTKNLFCQSYYPWSFWHNPWTSSSTADSIDREYRAILRSIASMYGFSPSFVDDLLKDGFTTDEIEELIYSGIY